MKKEYDFSKLKEIKNPYPGKKKVVGTNFEFGSCGLFQGTGGGDGTSLLEADRSLSAGVREEAEEADHEVGGVAAEGY